MIQIYEIVWARVAEKDLIAIIDHIATLLRNIWDYSVSVCYDSNIFTLVS